MRDYIAYRYKEGKMFDEEEIMRDLSTELRQRILRHNSRDIFVRVPLFAVSAPDDFVSRMATHIQPLVFFQSSLVFHKGVTADNVYFIHTGTIQLFLPARAAGGDDEEKESKDPDEVHREEVVLCSISEGCYFGECSVLLEQQKKRSTSARAVELTNAYSIEGSELLDCLNDHPSVKRRMMTAAAQRLMRVKFKQGSVPLLPPSFEVDQEDAFAADFRRERERFHDTHISTEKAVAVDDQTASTPLRAAKRARASLALGQRALILEEAIAEDDAAGISINDVDIDEAGRKSFMATTPRDMPSPRMPSPKKHGARKGKGAGGRRNSAGGLDTFLHRFRGEKKPWQDSGESSDDEGKKVELTPKGALTPTHERREKGV